MKNLFKYCLVIIFGLSMFMQSCQKEESTELVQQEEIVETRRDGKVVGPGNWDPSVNYPECGDVTFHVISGMYNQAEDVICCNYASGDEFIEVIAFGVDESHDLEWNVQGTSIIADVGSTVFANLGCPNVGTCKWLTFQIIDHTAKCKSTFNTEICNNTGPCFITPVDTDCMPGESALECLCRKYPTMPMCEGSGGMN